MTKVRDLEKKVMVLEKRLLELGEIENEESDRIYIEIMMLEELIEYKRREELNEKEPADYCKRCGGVKGISKKGRFVSSCCRYDNFRDGIMVQ